MTPELQQQLALIMNSLTEFGKKVGPQVVDTVVAFKQVDGIYNICSGLLGLAFIVWFFSTLSKRLQVISEEINDTDISAKGGYSIMMLIASILAAMFAFAELTKLFYIWNWIALFNPKLAVAHDIYVSIMHKVFN